MTRETLELLRACALQAPADELAERFRAVSLEDLLPAARAHGMLSGLAVALRDVPDVPEQRAGAKQFQGLPGHSPNLASGSWPFLPGGGPTS